MRRLQAGAREAQEVAAIGDADVVRIGNRAMASKIARGWILPSAPVAGALLGRRPLAPARDGSGAGLGPGLVDCRLAVACGLDHRRKRELRRGEQFGLAAAIVDQFAGIVGEADEARMREHRGRAIADLIIELAADQEHDIGLGHRRGPHRRRTTRDDRPAPGLGFPGYRDKARRWRRAGARARPPPRARRGR